MILRAFAPAWCERFANRLLAFAGIVLAVCGVALRGVNWEVFLHVRAMGIAALVALLLAALAIGHALGGPAPDDRTALAVACSTRHIGLAVLVAASFPGSRSAVLVAVYILVSMLVTLPYLRWRRWQAGLQVSDGVAG